MSSLKGLAKDLIQIKKNNEAGVIYKSQEDKEFFENLNKDISDWANSEEGRKELEDLYREFNNTDKDLN